MEPDMKDTGEKINSMVKVWKHGQMVLVIKEIMLMVRNMEKVLLHGLMEVPIMVNLMKII
jgi:hypothetical protein